MVLQLSERDERHDQVSTQEAPVPKLNGAEHMSKIVWREWFNEMAVKKLTEMGTLPRNEIEIDTRFSNGRDVAADIAKRCNEQDCEQFQKSGEYIVILEPEEFAGDYEIDVDYEPHFFARVADDL